MPCIKLQCSIIILDAVAKWHICKSIWQPGKKFSCQPIIVLFSFKGKLLLS